MQSIPSATQIPPCKHFGACGGCALQQLAPKDYAAYKHVQFHDILRRAGLAAEQEGEMVIVGPHARRRATFKVEFHPKKAKLGFFAKRSHEIIELEHCLVVDEVLFSTAQQLVNHFVQNKIEVSAIKEISITNCDGMLDVVLYATKPPVFQMLEFIPTVANELNISRISWKHKEELMPIVERRAVTLQWGSAKVSIPPESFLQASKVAQEAMTDIIIKYIKNKKQIIDLYCGCGSYTFPVAEYANVHGVEGDASMIATLNQAVARGGLHGRVTAEVRDLYNQPVTAKALKKYDMAVINPPRNGAEPQVKQLAESAISTIVMVSCNPITFARDAKILVNAGYRFVSVTAVDQFYWSTHLECVGVFER